MHNFNLTYHYSGIAISFICTILSRLETKCDGAVLKGGEAGSGRLARRALLADNWLYLFNSK